MHARVHTHAQRHTHTHTHTYTHTHSDAHTHAALDTHVSSYPLSGIFMSWVPVIFADVYAVTLSSAIASMVPPHVSLFLSFFARCCGSFLCFLSVSRVSLLSYSLLLSLSLSLSLSLFLGLCVCVSLAHRVFLFSLLSRVMCGFMCLSNVGVFKLGVRVCSRFFRPPQRARPHPPPRSTSPTTLQPSSRPCSYRPQFWRWSAHPLTPHTHTHVPH